MYTVWFETVSGRDGEKIFHSLKDAEREFDEKTKSKNILMTEIQHNGQTIRQFPRIKRAKKNPKRRSRKLRTPRKVHASKQIRFYTRTVKMPLTEKKWIEDALRKKLKRKVKIARKGKKLFHSKKMRVLRVQRGSRARIVKRNPLSKFVIGATITNSGKHWYYRQSTQSFVASLYDATHFKSKTVASRIARSILKQLPSKIAAIHVDSVKE